MVLQTIVSPISTEGAGKETIGKVVAFEKFAFLLVGDGTQRICLAFCISGFGDIAIDTIDVRLLAIAHLTDGCIIKTELIYDSCHNLRGF